MLNLNKTTHKIVLINFLAKLNTKYLIKAFYIYC